MGRGWRKSWRSAVKSYLAYNPALILTEREEEEGRTDFRSDALLYSSKVLAKIILAKGKLLHGSSDATKSGPQG